MPYSPHSTPPPDLGRAKARRASSDEPDIIPPHLAEALDALEARQAKDWDALIRIEGLAKLMDAQFAVPFTQIRVGLDSIIGIVPGIGDTISFGVSGYIILQAKRMGANSGQTMQMILNSFIDWLIGLVPVIGDLLDIGWRSNMRNTAYLREIMERKWAQEHSDLLRDYV